jgi:hypothetical protein
VDATVGLHVGDKEPVSLQPNREGGVYLVIGDNIEVTLTQSHMTALHQQSSALLGDLQMLDAAEQQVIKARVAGEQASRSARHAMELADKAMAVGAAKEAQDARTAAGRAAAAATLVANTVQAALTAMDTADEATEAAGAAAAAAIRVIAQTKGDA